VRASRALPASLCYAPSCQSCNGCVSIGVYKRLERHTKEGVEGEVAMLTDASDGWILFKKVRLRRGRARLDSFRFP
jgi:hypothetical protein